MTFFFAGMDTTGHLIGMALYKLAKYTYKLNNLNNLIYSTLFNNYVIQR